MIGYICIYSKKFFHKFIVQPTTKSLFLKCGKNVHIGENSRFNYSHISLGNNVSIGVNSIYISAVAKINIGNYVMIGPNVVIVTGNHRTDVLGEYMYNVKNKLQENDADVNIEDDVWIGANVIILKGVNIGRGSVIAAGSLVNKDIDPYSVYGGNPAKLIAKRLTPEEIIKHEAILLQNKQCQ
jgi:acetyltransferase-like isoleucine patch superfamily enzyme